MPTLKSTLFVRRRNLIRQTEKTILIYPCGKTATHYTIPDGITAIHNSAFATCHNLESIDCPESVTSIGTSAFMLCTSLKSITLPQHLDKINGGVFCNCQSLKSITLPESITSIEFMAFHPAGRSNQSIFPTLSPESGIKLLNSALPSYPSNCLQASPKSENMHFMEQELLKSPYRKALQN